MTLCRFVFIVILIKMENKRKKYIRIECGADSDEVLAILDSIESEDEGDIDNLLNDSDTEFVSDESVPAPPANSNCVLTPEANVHIIPSAETSMTEPTPPPSKKRKTKLPESAFDWSCMPVRRGGSSRRR